MRLTSDVHLVGGGTLSGFGVSSDFDAHCYLLDGGGEQVLVECGMGTDTGYQRVTGNIRSAGFDPAAVTRLFLTHHHTDHAGGASVYRERLGLAVATGAATGRALETGDHEATSFALAQAAGIFPDGYSYEPCPVDDRLTDGAQRWVGRLTLTYLDTPGHCGGHGSYLVEGGEQTYLFAGDAVFAWGKLHLQAIPDCDLQASLATVLALAELEFDALLPGHGAIALHDGKAHIGMAKDAIDQLAVPPRLV
ncbi:MAG: MBL fold metallo-hydrolase [Acidimicrobiia bacterium]|nr:MBL fold metallo-hydrolase [Acidimicrobiia bacterium]